MPFTLRRVAHVRRNNGLKPRYEKLRECGLPTNNESAERLDVSPVLDPGLFWLETSGLFQVPCWRLLMNQRQTGTGLLFKREAFSSSGAVHLVHCREPLARDRVSAPFGEQSQAMAQGQLSSSTEWKKAHCTDGNFVTSYARDNPDKEDMAESTLFAWALLIHPEQLPKSVEEKVRTVMPNRHAFFRKVFVDGKPTFYRVRPAKNC